MAESASSSSAVPPKKKRTFFKKPSWKEKTENADDDDPTSMFDASRQTFSAIMEEQERARLKKLQDREEKAKQREKKREEDKARKRRKISPDGHDNSDEDNRHNRNNSQKLGEASLPTNLSPSPPPKTQSTSLSARYEAAAEAQRSERKPAEVIDLGDSNSEDEAAPSIEEAAKQDAPTDPDDDIDSDPEIRRLVLESRRKRKLAEHRQASQGMTPAPGLGGHQDSFTSGGRNNSTPMSPADPLPDAPIQIFINPRIPGTRPLIVTRKISQRMKEVREAWCKRQGFDDEMSDSVMLLFRGIRVFDVASSRSLGLSVDEDGRVRMRGTDDWDEDDSKIVLDAVTQDILDEEKREAQRKLEPGPEPELEPEPEQENNIKLIIKTKDHGETKLRVKSTTTFERIVGAATNRLKVPKGKRAYLLFDGDRLEPDGTMGDLDEFENEDALEMHFD